MSAHHGITTKDFSDGVKVVFSQVGYGQVFRHILVDGTVDSLGLAATVAEESLGLKLIDSARTMAQCTGSIGSRYVESRGNSATMGIWFREEPTPPEDEKPEGLAVTEVKVDNPRGHISMVADGVGEGAFCDLGSELHWWSHSSLHLGPEQARELGEALVAWADKRQPKADDGPTLLQDLKALLAGARGTARVTTHSVQQLVKKHEGR